MPEVFHLIFIFYFSYGKCFLIVIGKARQILFIEHKFYTTVVDPKCFTLKITEFKRERKRRQHKIKQVSKTIKM